MENGEPYPPSACEACGHANPVGSSFCGDCGEKLGAIACPQCGTSTAPGQRFCNDCGNALDQRESRPEPARTPEHISERKQVTVVFADVIGSMTLAEEIDPDRWSEIVAGLFQVLADSVRQYGGTVDKFTGDGVMAIFGAPIAQEDHADRGCQAALEMLDRVTSYSKQLQANSGTSIEVRVGVSSGDVVAGEIGAEGDSDYTAIGHTVGLAQRMESLAEPGTAYVSARTANLVSPAVRLEHLGEFDVKGSSQALGVFRLSGVELSDRAARLTPERTAMSPFVGRDGELEELVNVLDRAMSGQGAVVGIVGEAGLGKSRLCHELIAVAEARGIKVCRAQCQAHTSNMPLFPARQLMRSYFGVAPEDTDAEARHKVERGLTEIGPAFDEEVLLVHEFLSIADPERPLPAMNPEAKRRRLFDLTRHVLHARTDPVLNVVEDLHWIDPASNIFMSAFVDAVPGTPTMLVTNFRPEFQGEWSSRSHYRRIPLQPLDTDDVREMLGRSLGEDPSLDGMIELLHERTGGNPFFAEETVRELVESGALSGENGAYRLVNQVDNLAVPATVQSVLAARIDRLSPTAKMTLGAASAISSEFRQDVLASVTGLSPAALEEVLDELVAGEFIDLSRAFPTTEYRFRHPLTREVAYGSQLSSARARIHRSIAQTLEEKFPEQLDEQSGFIAAHHESSGDIAAAVEWFSRAAAFAGYADPHAANDIWLHVKELAEKLPSGLEGDRSRAAARLMLVNLSWRVAANLDETTTNFEEAESILRRLDDTTARALLLAAYGNSRGNTVGDVPQYMRYVEEGLNTTDESTPPEIIAALLVATIYPFYLAGRFEDAINMADKAIELCGSDPTFGGGVILASPCAFAYGFRAMPLASIGRVSEARESLAKGNELAREHDRETLCWSLGIKLVTGLWGVEAWSSELMDTALEAFDVAANHGDAFAQAVAETWLGAAYVRSGDHDAAKRHLDRFFEIADARGVAINFAPYSRHFRAGLLAHIGLIEAALEEQQRAVDAGYETGNVSSLPLLLRTLARYHVLRASDGDLERAEQLLDEAERECRRFGHKLELTALRIDRALLRRSRGEFAEFSIELDEAEREATEIDARTLTAEIADLRQTAGI